MEIDNKRVAYYDVWEKASWLVFFMLIIASKVFFITLSA